MVEELGGADALLFNYLGEEMTIQDVPKKVVWMPFGEAVYFPSEGM